MRRAGCWLLLSLVLVVSPSHSFLLCNTKHVPFHHQRNSRREFQSPTPKAGRTNFLTPIHSTKGSGPGASRNEQQDSAADPYNNNNPDPSTLVCAQDDATQKKVFVASFGALAVGTTVAIQGGWYGLAPWLLGGAYVHTIATVVFPLGFGIVYTLVGSVGHFYFVKNISRMVPPRGSWGGLWQVPAPLQTVLGGVTYEEYHCYWSGIAEIIGGLWLLAAGLGLTEDGTTPAGLLFLLTIAVTPSNLYMYTHNTGPGGWIPPLPYPNGHYARFVLQCILLSNFYLMWHPPPVVVGS